MRGLNKGRLTEVQQVERSLRSTRSVTRCFGWSMPPVLAGIGRRYSIQTKCTAPSRETEAQTPSVCFRNARNSASSISPEAIAISGGAPRHSHVRKCVRYKADPKKPHR